MQRLILITFLLVPALLLAGSGFAQDSEGIDSGDTTWVLLSTALVMLMTPGLALFYSGLVRRKNVLATMMHSFILMAVIGLQWVLWGYTLAFGPDVGGVIGGLDYLGLEGIDLLGPSAYASTIPSLAFIMFQGMFAVITPALISGAIAERMRFSAFLVFSLLWATLVYDPLAHWVWGGGWLGELGALDFAGGLVVHISSGAGALIAAIMVGKRRGKYMPTMTPHNLPMTVLGATLLWFGWFGFNAGSALSANSTAALAFAVTNTATCAAILTWVLLEWRFDGKPTVLGAVTGAVAGLVAITPAAGFVGPLASIAIGAGAGLFCFIAVDWIKPRLGYDDALDVFGVHGVGGIWGALATGLFATTLVNPDGADGLFSGNPGQLGVQLISILVAVGYTFVLTFILLKFVDILFGLRVKENDEVIGLDISQHRESGYTILD